MQCRTQSVHFRATPSLATPTSVLSESRLAGLLGRLLPQLLRTQLAARIGEQMQLIAGGGNLTTIPTAPLHSCSKTYCRRSYLSVAAAVKEAIEPLWSAWEPARRAVPSAWTAYEAVVLAAVDGVAGGSPNERRQEVAEACGDSCIKGGSVPWDRPAGRCAFCTTSIRLTSALSTVAWSLPCTAVHDGGAPGSAGCAAASCCCRRRGINKIVRVTKCDGRSPSYCASTENVNPIHGRYSIRVISTSR